MLVDAIWTQNRYKWVMSSVEHRRPRDHLFVVRFWNEERTPDGGAWRGQVTEVSSRERRYFSNYGELCEFLDRTRKAGQ